MALLRSVPSSVLILDAKFPCCTVTLALEKLVLAPVVLLDDLDWKPSQLPAME
jgi:hypothetical protein